MSLTDLIKTYEDLRRKIKALNYALWMISWDTETEVPSGALAYRSKQVGILSEELYKLTTSEEMIKVVKELYDRKDELDEVLAREIYLAEKRIEKQLKIPMEEYVEYQTLIAQTQSIWADAKRQNNYELFKPSLEKIVELTKKRIKYLETDELKGYDVLLDEFEEGMTSVKYDHFFNTLKKDLVPFVMEVINKKQKTFAFDKLNYPIDLQKQFVSYLMDVLGYDQKHGLIKESEHPCTSNVSSTDVRITNHYYEDNFTSGIFSAIHEMGHALYEQQVDPALDDTMLAGGASMALHESQSRFYENIIGRSYAFWQAHYPKLQATFKDQLKEVTLDQFYQYINNSYASYIRTDADELTYSLHIMIRYEIEKDLMEERITVDELPQVWNSLTEKYLGIVPRNDQEGILQDVHWSAGLFGYFPTYALGSAYSAQIYEAMKRDLDIEKELLNGTTLAINKWLQEKIHRYGQSKAPIEIFESAVNAKFDASYFVTYLKDKYQNLK